MNVTEKSPPELIASCQGLVKSLAAKIHRGLPRHFELDDLVSFGQVGLAEAARDFDSGRGLSFTTYAYYRVRGAILDGLSKMSWFNRSQFARNRFDSLACDVFDVATDQSDAGRLSDDVRWLKQLGGALAMVYLCARSGDEASDSMAALEDPSAPSPAAAAIERETKCRLHELIDGLPPDAAALIRATYFEGLTLKEAGERLGISKAWASRLHARTLERLGRALARQGLA